MSFEDMPKRLEQIHYPKNAVSIVVFNEKDEILMIRSRRYTTMYLSILYALEFRDCR